MALSRRRTYSSPTSLVLLVLGLLLTLLLAPAAADTYPPGEPINPAKLEAGAATPVLHTVGTRIVDGPHQVTVRAGHLSMLGRAGTDYIVSTTDAEYRNWRLLRVARDGSQTVLARGRSYAPDFILQDGGVHVAISSYTRDDQTLLRVVETNGGTVTRQRTFGPTVSPLEFGADGVVLSEWDTSKRTFWWDPVTNRTKLIVRLPGYRADAGADRLGVFLGDPYQGGCQKVVQLSAPATRLWRSCRDIALSFSPAGERMVTAHILSDGPGPRVIQVRRDTGRLLDTYRARWFGFMTWENDRRLLLQASSPTRVGVVRCTLGSCERISRLYAVGDREPWTVMPSWTFADETMAEARAAQ